MQEVEIVDSLNGKTLNGHISRICKSSFFKRYLKLMKQLQPNIKVPIAYSDAKAAALDYQVSLVNNIDCFVWSII